MTVRAWCTRTIPQGTVVRSPSGHCEDGGSRTWSPTNEGPANVSVDELFWSGTALLAATHGRGMYRIELGQV